MILLMTLAALLIAFSGFCVFGVPFMLIGPRVWDEFSKNREQQVMGGLIATAIMALVLLPFASPALISAPTDGQLMADLYLGQFQA